MTERLNPAELMRHTRAYWYVDGLWELATGGFFLLVALFMAWQAVTPQGSWWWLVFGLGGPPLLIGGNLVARRLVERVKARTTYPRTGYVKHDWAVRKGVFSPRLVGATVLGGLLVMILVIVGWQPIALPGFFGAFGLVVLAAVGRSLGLRRFYALAAWSGLAGAITSLLPVPSLAGGALFWLTLGLGCLGSGLYALRRYLRSATTQPEEIAS